MTAITASSLLGYEATILVHLYLGSFSHSSLQILSSSIRLDGKHGCTAFSGLSRDVRSGSSPGSGRATQGHCETCPEATTACPGCVLRVVVLLEGEHLPQSEVLSALEQVFIKDLSILAPFIFPLILTSLTVPDAEKHPNSMMLPPICQVSSKREAWHSGQRVQSWFHQTREYCFSWSESLLVFNSKRAVMCL